MLGAAFLDPIDPWRAGFGSAICTRSSFSKSSCSYSSPASWLSVLVGCPGVGLLILTTPSRGGALVEVVLGLVGLRCCSFYLPCPSICNDILFCSMMLAFYCCCWIRDYTNFLLYWRLTWPFYGSLDTFNSFWLVLSINELWPAIIPGLFELFSLIESFGRSSFGYLLVSSLVLVLSCFYFESGFRLRVLSPILGKAWLYATPPSVVFTVSYLCLFRWCLDFLMSGRFAWMMFCLALLVSDVSSIFWLLLLKLRLSAES